VATQAVHLWRATSARTVAFDELATPRGTLSRLPLAWPVKDPGDVLDYTLDIGPSLAGDPGDRIATLDVSITPFSAGDLRMLSAAADGTRACVWLSGGQPGILYHVTFLVGTAAGRSIQRTVQLAVEAVADPGRYAVNLMTEIGQPLTDHKGAPLQLDDP
jgi:hypothetical protein